MTQYIIIIFTRGDILKRGEEEIEEVMSRAPDDLCRVLVECGNRYVVFDNMVDDKQQVERLMEKVRKLSEAHGGKPYTHHKYSENGETMDEEVERRLWKVEEDEVKNKKYVKELKDNLKRAEEELTRKKRESEERESKKREEKMREFEKGIKHLEIAMDFSVKCIQNLQSFSAKCEKEIGFFKKLEARINQMEEVEQKLKEKIESLQQKQDQQSQELYEMWVRVKEKEMIYDKQPHFDFLPHEVKTINKALCEKPCTCPIECNEMKKEKRIPKKSEEEKIERNYCFQEPEETAKEIKNETENENGEFEKKETKEDDENRRKAEEREDTIQKLKAILNEQQLSSDGMPDKETDCQDTEEAILEFEKHK